MTEHKGFNIKHAGGPLGYSVHSVGAGALPNRLKGHFTSYSTAKREIDLYVDGKTTGLAGKAKAAKED